MRRTTTLRAAVARSVSFSGAGFLGAYHAGAIAALQRADYLPDYSTADGRAAANARASSVDHPPPVLLGSSAGALVAAGVVTGQSTDAFMAICHELSAVARKQVRWIHPRPSSVETGKVSEVRPAYASHLDSGLCSA